jgi:hypothetical protein
MEVGCCWDFAKHREACKAVWVSVVVRSSYYLAVSAWGANLISPTFYVFEHKGGRPQPTLRSTVTSSRFCLFQFELGLGFNSGHEAVLSPDIGDSLQPNQMEGCSLQLRKLQSN